MNLYNRLRLAIEEWKVNAFSSKTWRMFLFEIVCIFIAVSLAFGLNKWNEISNQRNKEIEILEQIKLGLEKDLIDFEENQGGHKRGIAFLKKYEDFTLKNKPFVDSFTFERGLVSVLRTFISIQNTSAFESLKSIGFDLVSNDSLRLDIINLYEIRYRTVIKFEETYYENNLNALFYHEMNDIFSKYGLNLPGANLKSINLTTFEKNKLKSMYTKIYIARNLSLGLYEETIKDVNKVQKGIDQELIKLNKGFSLF